VADRPNILFFHVDNLGFGELSGPLWKFVQSGYAAFL
jgi:hypothetical protein